MENQDKILNEVGVLMEIFSFHQFFQQVCLPVEYLGKKLEEIRMGSIVYSS